MVELPGNSSIVENRARGKWRMSCLDCEWVREGEGKFPDRRMYAEYREHWKADHDRTI